MTQAEFNVLNFPISMQEQAKRVSQDNPETYYCPDCGNTQLDDGPCIECGHPTIKQGNRQWKR